MSKVLQLPRYTPRHGSSTPGGIDAPSQILGFTLAAADVVNESGTVTSNKVRIYASTLAGGSAVDLGFSEGDPDPGYLLTISGTGVVYVELTVDEEGAFDSKSLGNGATLPTTNPTKEIGTYSIDSETGRTLVSNSCYGPIEAAVCGDEVIFY